MSHKFEIRKNKKGDFVAYFVFNSETIWWTEGYSSKASAKNAIASILKNGPNAEVRDKFELDKPVEKIKEKTVEQDRISVLKEKINSLTYVELISVCGGINAQVETYLSDEELAQGISAWANP